MPYDWLKVRDLVERVDSQSSKASQGNLANHMSGCNIKLFPKFQGAGSATQHFMESEVTCGVVKEVLVTQVYHCFAAQVALHLVLAQLVSEMMCVYVVLLCWIGCAPEEVASGHEVRLDSGLCEALPVHGRRRSANCVRKIRGCFINVLVVLVVAVTSYCVSDVHKFHRSQARIQFNSGYDDLNASGAQEWSVCVSVLLGGSRDAR